MNNVTQSVQRALQAYVQTGVLPFLEDSEHVYTSLLGPDVEATVPNVLIKSQRAQCTVSTEGSWRARATIELREAHDDTDAEDHFDHAGLLFALFFTDTAADEITAAAPDPFTAFQIVKVEQGWRVDGRLWVSYLDIDLDCCTSDIG